MFVSLTRDLSYYIFWSFASPFLIFFAIFWHYFFAKTLKPAAYIYQDNIKAKRREGDICFTSPPRLNRYRSLAGKQQQQTFLPVIQTGYSRHNLTLTHTCRFFREAHPYVPGLLPLHMQRNAVVCIPFVGGIDNIKILPVIR